eukprot:10291027-Lingulodinium_polyedra.AAC.1
MPGAGARHVCCPLMDEHPGPEAQGSDPGGHGGGARRHTTIAGGLAFARRPSRQIVEAQEADRA